MSDPIARLESRLHSLRGEYERGRQQLAHLRQQERALQETMLRISGAIQVLEELVAEGAPSCAPSAAPEEAAPVPAVNGKQR